MSTTATEQDGTTEQEPSTTTTEQQPTGGTGQAPQVDENTPVDVSTLPPNVQKLIREARGEAAGNRKGRTEAEQKYATTLDGIARALGLKGEDDRPDPERLAKELADRDSKLNQTLAENAILRNAPKVKGDPDALTDSTSFMTAMSKLDPTAEDYDTKVRETIKDAVAKNPRLGLGQSLGAGSRDQSATSADTRTVDQKYREGERIPDEELEKLARKGRRKF